MQGKSSVHLKPFHVLVGGLMVLLAGYLWGQKGNSSTSAFQAELSSLREELLQLRSTLGNDAKAATKACPACNCPACPSCPACNCPACAACPEKEHCPPACDQHGKYNLSHLDQPANQDVIGPVQDDEALFLYSIVRGMRLSRVLEIGGLSGYSAKNFLQAMEPTQGVVYTVDVRPVPPVDSTRHKCILKDAGLLTAADVDGQPLDLVFFDAHVFDAQWNMFNALVNASLIADYTLLAFHDTNTHPYKVVSWAFESEEGGWVHHSAEPKLVNMLHKLGWDAFMLHPRKETHNQDFPYRHGAVVMQRFERLPTRRKKADSPAPT